MARKDRQEFDWLDDPFNEKKATAAPPGMSGATKAALAGGCVLAIIVIVGLLVLVGTGIFDILSSR